MAADVAASAYLREMVGLLWPDASVELCRAHPVRVRRRAGQDLVVLPRATQPRLLVPASPAKAAAALRGYQTSATGRTRRKARLVAVLARAGATRLAPTVVRICSSGQAEGIDAHLARILGRAVDISIHLGPPRAVRKPVIQLLDAETHQTIGFAKVGVNPLTRELVAREAANLADLQGHDLHRLRIPELLHHGGWQGLDLLVQSALTPEGSAPPTVGDVEAAMLELSGVRGLMTGTLRSHRYLGQLRSRIDRCPTSPAASAVEEALDRIAAPAADLELRFGAWHGDWTPWNMAAGGRRRLLVWDWEHFEPDVPAGYDRLHHHLHCELRSGRDPGAALASMRQAAAGLLRHFQPSDPARELTALLYVVDIATRYLNDEEAAGATLLGDVSSWLATGLDAPCRSAVRAP